MPRKYKVSESRPNGLPAVERTYSGFNMKIDPDTKYITLVRSEDATLVYALDDPKNVSEFIEYLAEHEGPDPKIIGVFQRIK